MSQKKLQTIISCKIVSPLRRHYCQSFTCFCCHLNQIYAYCVLYNFWFLYPKCLTFIFSNQSHHGMQCINPILHILCITVLKDLILYTYCCMCKNNVHCHILQKEKSIYKKCNQYPSVIPTKTTNKPQTLRKKSQCSPQKIIYDFIKQQ